MKDESRKKIQEKIKNIKFVVLILNVQWQGETSEINSRFFYSFSFRIRFLCEVIYFFLCLFQIVNKSSTFNRLQYFGCYFPFYFYYNQKKLFISICRWRWLWWLLHSALLYVLVKMPPKIVKKDKQKDDSWRCQYHKSAPHVSFNFYFFFFFFK